jgi:hypothetical protein
MHNMAGQCTANWSSRNEVTVAQSSTVNPATLIQESTMYARPHAFSKKDRSPPPPPLRKIDLTHNKSGFENSDFSDNVSNDF